MFRVTTVTLVEVELNDAQLVSVTAIIDETGGAPSVYQGPAATIVAAAAIVRARAVLAPAASSEE